MSLESKIDDIKEAIYEIRPVVTRLEDNLKSVELRIGTMENNQTKIDVRVSFLEKQLDRRPRAWRFKFSSILEMLAALPIAAHLIPSIIMFVAALLTFVHEYIKMHHVP